MMWKVVGSDILLGSVLKPIDWALDAGMIEPMPLLPLALASADISIVTKRG
jgi:hypothetical protein